MRTKSNSDSIVCTIRVADDKIGTLLLLFRDFFFSALQFDKSKKFGAFFYITFSRADMVPHYHCRNHYDGCRHKEYQKYGFGSYFIEKK